MSLKRIILAILGVTLAFPSLTPQIPISLHTSLATSSFRLPIASGLTGFVYQGNNDIQHDHVGKAAWAFDFTVGATHFVVTAAQGGTIIGADDSSTTGCGDVSCWTQANYVLIADDDGKTAALYLHLQHNSLKIKSGMHVNQGESLGLADTTGWATGPHLHFQVEDIPSAVAPQQFPGWWWRQSIPVSFANPEVLAKNANGVPKEGQSFDVSNSPVVSSPQTATPILMPTPPTPVLVPTPTPPPTTSQVTVQANSDWQASGVSVQQGEVVTIVYVSGNWRPWPGVDFDGKGCTQGCDPTTNNLIVGCDHGGLIGRIGSDQMVCILNGTTVTATESGQLYLRINDQMTSDDSGAINVQITLK